MALTDVLTGAASAGLSLLRPSRAVDVVAVLGPGYLPIFQSARPLAATVYEDAKLMEHPLETGAVIADHIVVEPLEIELPCIIRGELAYRNTYAALKTAFLGGQLLTVMTRTGIYPDMVLVGMPHEERPSSFDAIEIAIRLRHAVFVQPQGGDLSASKVQDPKQASTAKRGAQQTTATNAAKTGSASSTMKNAGTNGTPAAGAEARGSTLYQWVYGE